MTFVKDDKDDNEYFIGILVIMTIYFIEKIFSLEDYFLKDFFDWGYGYMQYFLMAIM